MGAEEWIELLKKIPAEYHEQLLVATTQGVEISFQQLLQMNEHYLLVRGRLGGTTDAGKIFCLPYDRLLYLVLTRPVSDARLAELFGPLLTPPRPDLSTAAVQPELTAPEPEPTPVTPTPIEAPGRQGAAASLRERLRLRMPIPAVKPAEVEPKAPTPAPQAPAAAATPDAARPAAASSLRERLRARFGGGSSPGIDKPK